MLTTLLLAITAVLCYVTVTWRVKLRHIPGYRVLPVFGHLLHVKIHVLHKQFESWSRTHGPVNRLQLINKAEIVVNDFDSIYQVLVSKSRDFAGRPYGVRISNVFANTGILTSTDPDATWRALRKAAHRHLKQFGDGLSRLESVITDIGDDMFDDFRLRSASEIDPHQIVFDTALNTVAFLITGTRTRTGEPVVEEMREFEEMGPKYILSSKLQHFIYEVLPFLKHLRLSGWRDIESVQEREERIWSLVKDLRLEHTSIDSLVSVMLQHSQGGSTAASYTEQDIRKTIVSLLFAGVATTSATFYGGINILAHHAHVQDKVRAEILATIGNRAPSLQDRAQLPYTHATLLELLRYTSVVPLGIPHKALCDVTLSGYHVPKGTHVITNLWAMHHNQGFWGDPYAFRPERFLDGNGQVVFADHPNRKHLMPFGAGTRVCLGESMAMARIFLWITTLVQRFEVVPAPGNPVTSCDPRNFEMTAVLKATRYRVIITSRE